MSDAVAQSLITACAGFLGALLGAVAAVFGPWVLRRQDRRAEATQQRIEAKRAAVVEWVDANIRLSNYNGTDSAELRQLSANANRSLTELSSRLETGEKLIDDWIHGLGVYGAHGVSWYWRGSAYGTAGRMLLSWTRGELELTDFKPFMLDAATGGFTVRKEWPTAAELRTAFPSA